MGGRGMGSATSRVGKSSKLISSPKHMAELRSKAESALSIDPKHPSAFDFGKRQMTAYASKYDFIHQQHQAVIDAFNAIARTEERRGKVGRDEFVRIMRENDSSGATRKLGYSLKAISSAFEQMQKIIEDSKKSKF